MWQRRMTALAGVIAAVVTACGGVPAEVRAGDGAATADAPVARSALPAFSGRLVVYDPAQLDGPVLAWRLNYDGERNWTMIQTKRVVPDAEATGFPVPYYTITMDGDHYVQIHHDLTDISGVPPDVRARYEPTFMQLPPREQYALLVEGIRRGWVKVVDRVVGEASGSAPVPPTPLFEIVTPYPWQFGGTPGLARTVEDRPDGSRVVTLTGLLTCAEARVSASLCGEGDAPMRVRRSVVRRVEVRPDGIPVRFTERFDGVLTKQIALDDVVVK